jgi:opacity protein-like surface antigen
MQKLFVLALFLTIGNLPIAAQSPSTQSTPVFHAFGGYQYFRDGFSGGQNLNGLEGSFAVDIARHLNVAADFGTASKTVSGVTERITTYTFGPSVFVSPHARVDPFAHVLFGGVSARASASEEGYNISASQNFFAMKVGGGADLKVSQLVSVRLVQFDWNYFHGHNETLKDEISIAPGVVFNF